MSVDSSKSKYAKDMQVIKISPNTQGNSQPVKQWTIQICSGGGIVYLRDQMSPSVVNFEGFLEPQPNVA